MFKERTEREQKVPFSCAVGFKYFFLSQPLILLLVTEFSEYAAYYLLARLCLEELIKV